MSEKATERYERDNDEPLDWHAIFQDVRDMAASGMLGDAIAYDPGKDKSRHELASRPQRDFTRPPAGR